MHTSRVMVTYCVGGSKGNKLLNGTDSGVRSVEVSQVMHSLCVCMLLDAWLGLFLQLFSQAAPCHFRIIEDLCKPDYIDSVWLLA